MYCQKSGVDFRVDVGYCGGDPVWRLACQSVHQAEELTVINIISVDNSLIISLRSKVLVKRSQCLV